MTAVGICRGCPKGDHCRGQTDRNVSGGEGAFHCICSCRPKMPKPSDSPN